MSVEVIEPPSEEVLEKVRSEFGLNERRVREAVELLKNWLELQPHLPKEMDESRLERRLIRCKNRIEKVKKTLDLYYTLRTKVPDVMTGWDTKADWFQTASKEVAFVPMPQMTPEFDRVVIGALLTSDITKLDSLSHFKLSQMVQEIRISEDYCRADIYILDCRYGTLGHVSTITPTKLKKAELCVLGGYNLRVKAVHFLNIASYMEPVISLLKTLSKSKITERIYVHGSDLTSLYEQVPKDILPTEYGGEAGSLQENWDLWKKKIENYNEIFLERENQRSDESKRPDHSIVSSELSGLEGSFRKLDID